MNIEKNNYPMKKIDHLLRFGAALAVALALAAGCKTGSSSNAPLEKFIGELNVRNFGAIGDGTNKDTVAFQKALDACAAKGGGQVLVPPGNYLIGSIRLGPHTSLRLQQGSTIIGSGDTNDYPSVPVRWEGRWETGRCSLIYATNACDIAITGPGRIEGNPKMAAPQNPRGALVLEATSCNGVLWKDVTVTQGGNWATHPVYCTNVVICNVTIMGRRDGIDIDSCTNVVIDSCNINTGDDSISLKSGRGAQAVAIGRPTEDVKIISCTLVDHRFACIGIGSETSGGIRNVLIAHCKLSAPRSDGIYIKTRIGRGGAIENISADDLDVQDGGFLRVNLISSGNLNTVDDPVPGLAGYPQGRNFSFTNVRLTNATELADVSRISPEKPLEGFTLTNVTGTCTKGIVLANIIGASLSDIHVTGFKGALLTYTNVQGTGLDLQ